MKAMWILEIASHGPGDLLFAHNLPYPPTHQERVLPPHPQAVTILMPEVLHSLFLPTELPRFSVFMIEVKTPSVAL